MDNNINSDHDNDCMSQIVLCWIVILVLNGEKKIEKTSSKKPFIPKTRSYKHW